MVNFWSILWGNFHWQDDHRWRQWQCWLQTLQQQWKRIKKVTILATTTTYKILMLHLTLTVLVLDNWSKESNAPSSGGRRQHKARPLVGISALCSIQWFNNVGFMTGRTSVPFIPTGSVPEHVKKETERNHKTNKPRFSCTNVQWPLKIM